MLRLTSLKLFLIKCYAEVMTPLGEQCRVISTGTMRGKSFKLAVKCTVPPLLLETVDFVKL